MKRTRDFAAVLVGVCLVLLVCAVAKPASATSSPQQYSSYIVDASAIRFKTFLQLSELSGDSRKFLQDFLIPTALDWFVKRFQIRKPVLGKVQLQRECVEKIKWGYAQVGQVVNESQAFETCITYDEGKCGLAQVPSSHFSSQVFCSRDSPLDCQSTDHGAGVDGADVLLYFTSLSSGTCSLLPTSVSHGTFCKQDQHGRPVAVNINFCPDKLSLALSDRSATLVQLIKSIIHSLAFDYRLVPFFTDVSTGQPWVQPISDTFGLGRRLVLLNTTRARVAAREHFKCNNLPGLELENSNVFKLSYNMLLLEERIFHGEAMSSGSLKTRKGLMFSNLTFSVIEDTGWYERSSMNAYAPATLMFGKGAGCSFATGSCDTSADAGIFKADPAALHESYCHEDNKILRSSLIDQTAIEDTTLSSCTYDMRNVGYCSEAQDMDSCKIVVPEQISCSFDESDAADSSSGIYHEMHKRGWSFGMTSACFPSSLHRRTYQNSSLMWQPRGSECHQMTCINEIVNGDMADSLYIKISGLESEDAWVRCPSGQVLDLQEFGFIAGTLGPCPDNSRVCSQWKCPNSCSGNGNCVNSKCECYDGYAASADCSLIKCYQDSDCNPGLCDKNSGTCLSPPSPPPPPLPPPPPPSPPPPPPASPPGSIRGKAYLQGYLRNCLVYVDRNNNNKFDSESEPSSLTDSSGFYHIKHGYNWSPQGDKIYVNTYDGDNIKLILKGSPSCVDESTGLSLEHDIRSGFEGRITPSTGLAYALKDFVGKGSTASVLLQIAGFSNIQGTMLPDAVAVANSKEATRPAFLQLQLESHIETTVSLATSFLQSTSKLSKVKNSQDSELYDVVLSTLAKSVAEGSGNSRRALSSQTSSFQFNSTNSILWFLRETMTTVTDNSELVLSQAVAGVIADMNSKVTKEANSYYNFGTNGGAHDTTKYLNLCKLHYVALDRVQRLVVELGETRDLSQFTTQTSDDAINQFLLQTSIPASLKSQVASEETVPSSGSEEEGSKSWLDEGIIWITAGGVLFLAGLIWAILVHVVRKRKRKALKSIPDDPVEYYNSFKEKVQQIMRERRKQLGLETGVEAVVRKLKMKDSESGDLQKKSALQLAFTAAPPMPKTVWKKDVGPVSGKHLSSDLLVEDF